MATTRPLRMFTRELAGEGLGGRMWEGMGVNGGKGDKQEGGKRGGCSRKEGDKEGVAGRRETRRVLQEGRRQEGCCRFGA